MEEPLVIYQYTKGVQIMNMEGLDLNSPSTKKSKTSNPLAIMTYQVTTEGVTEKSVEGKLSKTMGRI